MIRGSIFRRRRALRAPVAALLAVCALAPASASAMARAGDADLSPRLAELATPAVRSLPPDAQAEELGLASSGAGSLLRDGGRVLVDVRFADGAIAALDELRAAGAEIVTPSRRYQTVTVAIAPSRLPALAAVPGVEGVSEKRAPLLFGGGSRATAAIGAECEGGSVVSEGVAQLQAATARSKYGVDGSGVTVGVLSDSYDQASAAADKSGPVATHAGEDVASGDLSGPANPCAAEKAPVRVVEDFSGPEASDEGRAMLQTVHDVAPGAELAFATAFFSELSFAQNIERLARPVIEGGAGAEVIVDDVVWFEEPFFQDGPVAVAVDKVVADGAAYFSAAGNNNLFEASNAIASWEAPSFRDSGGCPAALLVLPGIGSGNCMDFDPGAGVDDTFGITVSAGATLNLDLQWAEPWFGVETDLDAYLLDAGGDLLAVEDGDNVGNTQRPVELLQWENDSGSSEEVYLAINRCAAGCNMTAGSGTPLLKFALLQNGGGVTKTEYPAKASSDTFGPTIFGHAAASGAVATAAVNYSNPNQLEKFSSRGPATHHFEPVDGITPATALGSPETIAKPDIAATDCGETTFFAFFVPGEDAWRFCGTSAAAPHAAAVAALELEAKPAATVEELRNAQTGTAKPVGSFGPTAVGAGLLDADASIASLLPPATVAITGHPSSRTADSTPGFEFESTPPTTNFECSVDGVPQPCTSPFVASPLPDGPHLFKVDAVEATGSASFAFTVDTTPPAIAFANAPPAIGSNASPSIAFSANEPADFTCSIDGQVTPHCHSPSALSALADGSHRFELTAVDQVGNSGSASVSFTVDTVAPKLTLSAQPPAKSANPTPTFAFGANEPVTFACSIDGVAAQACTSPFLVRNPVADGSHGFGVLATDLAGNVAVATASFAVDTRPPQTFFASRLRGIVRTRQARARVSFRFGADEAGVGFECKVDRGPLRSCPARISRLFAPGTHTVRVKAHDEIGNFDRTPAVFRFRVERVGGAAGPARR
ncbi:MAG TPA: S8 family serine peptidase [Solirubrobacterales bacterium]|nr:S8 family serine peptidase [Solirubrobacterales bacterium]